MKNLFKILSITTVFVFSQSAYSADACRQFNNNITLMGLDSSTGTVYARVTGGAPSCGVVCGEFRFSDNNADTKKALDILVAAKISNLQVRIDRLHVNSCDSGYRVYIQ